MVEERERVIGCNRRGGMEKTNRGRKIRVREYKESGREREREREGGREVLSLIIYSWLCDRSLPNVSLSNYIKKTVGVC